MKAGMTNTANTVNNAQIEELCGESMAASDYRMVDICCHALGLDPCATTALGDGNPSECGDWTQEEARVECARAIADAAAQDDGE